MDKASASPLPLASPRIAFAANRPIGLECLQSLLGAGLKPVALLVASPPDAECAEAMSALLPGVPVFAGKSIDVTTLHDLAPDTLLSVHYPYVLPPDLLAIFTKGALNLHPALLPWNRGWHTPSWAILDGTPYGATLHWIDRGLDTGPIALQKEIHVLPADTAHSLYLRALAAEAAVFNDAIPLLIAGTLPRMPQQGPGTSHRKSDLDRVRKLDIENLTAVELLKKLRALTTSKPDEAGFLEMDGKRLSLRIAIHEQGKHPTG